MNNKKFNIFGFDRNNYVYGKQYRVCSIHHARLLPVEEDSTVLQCQSCGTRYPINDTVPEQNIQSTISPSKTKIVTAKKHKSELDKRLQNII